MIRHHNKTVYEALGRDPVHPFPARMAAGIALEAIGRAKRPLRILDPMMGSGTVLALARSKGHRAIGVDIDPLAVLISRAWTTAIDPAKVRARANAVLERARSLFERLPGREAYPPKADSETRQFIAHWFDDYSRRQLASLARAISRIRDHTARDILWCGFSRLIIAKSSGASLAMDLAHSRPHRVFACAPVKPFNQFLAAVERVAANCVDKKAGPRGPATRALEGDARHLALPDSSIDLVVTSPPYLNAIDYLRCSKFSLVWMGHTIPELRKVRAASVGTEVGGRAHQNDSTTNEIIASLRLRPRLSARHHSILQQYIQDLQRSLSEVARVLNPGGRAVYVVGENAVRGTFIRTASIVVATAIRSGLTLSGRRRRSLPSNRRYLPPPSGFRHNAALDGRVRREIVLSFKKARVQPSSVAASSNRPVR